MKHIIPKNDCSDHIEEVYCPCCPRFERISTGETVVIHSRFDWMDDDDDEERGNNPPPDEEGDILEPCLD